MIRDLAKYLYQTKSSDWAEVISVYILKILSLIDIKQGFNINYQSDRRKRTSIAGVCRHQVNLIGREENNSWKRKSEVPIRTEEKALTAETLMILTIKGLTGDIITTGGQE